MQYHEKEATPTAFPCLVRHIFHAPLDFYDSAGRLAHRLEVNLEEGKNQVEVPVGDWKSGAYNVIARGNGMPAYGRFLKVWED